MTEQKVWLDHLSPPEGSLIEVQRAGRKALLKMGSPNNSDEAWRLTDLSRLKEHLSLPLSSSSDINFKIPSFHNELVKDQGIQLIINGNEDPLKSKNLPKGIRVLDSQEIKKLIKQKEENLSWTEAINHASVQQILALSFEENELPPIELVFLATSQKLTATRVILLIKEEIKLHLNQIFLGSEDSSSNHLLEMHLGKNSKVNHYIVASGAKKASFMGNISIDQSENSDYSLTNIQKGWWLGRLETKISQTNGQAKTNLRGLQITSEKEQMATHSKVRFNGPEGSLNQLQKAVAFDRSHSIFNGAIEVPQIAQRTNASQLSRNLLLSNLARIDTKPELEIVADDVHCEHGATVSQLQEEELFYLRSRGIRFNQAMSLLLEGYCKEITNDIPSLVRRWGILKDIIKKEI